MRAIFFSVMMFYFSVGFAEDSSLSKAPKEKPAAAEVQGTPKEVSAETDEEPAISDSEVEAPLLTDEPEPVVHLEDGTAWTAPNYANQENAIGYKLEDFQISEGLKERAQFWIDIYTKFSSSQGVLHDSDNMGVVYENLDFSSIEGNPQLSSREKYRARKKRVDDEKKEVIARLKRLQNVTSAESLSGDDLRYWNLFSALSGKNKFLEAASGSRVRFQLGQRDFFTKGVYYSGRYLSEMERIFREEGVPVQLTRLPFVESSFNIYARSKVGASGIWQFMRSTGRRFMKVGFVIDERNDPLVATHAAAKMLRQNFKQLESWPLAITAYNHGPSGVARIAKKCNSKDICTLIEKGESRRFGFASKNFYASFLAAVEVESHASQYFGVVKRAPEIRYEMAQLTAPMNFKTLIRVFDGNQELAEIYNPHFTQSVRNGFVSMPQGASVRVPASKTDALMQAMSAKERVPTMMVEKETLYRVASGDTLSSISVMFGVPLRELVKANDVDPRRLQPGQKLIIPVAR